MILEKTKLSFVKFVVTLLLEIFDSLWILLNAFVSLEIELPTLEKSIEFMEEFESLGDNIVYAGVLTCAVLFFFW